MSKTGTVVMALSAAALVLMITTWFDSTIMSEARRQAAAAFDTSGVTPMIALGSLLVAGSVLLIGTLAWRAASVVVGLVYLVAGSFFVALPWLVWNLANQGNDMPPVLPEPLASALSSIYLSTTGSLNAAGTIGAAMLIGGAPALARWWRGRAVVASRAEVMAATADPTHSVDRTAAARRGSGTPRSGEGPGGAALVRRCNGGRAPRHPPIPARA